MRTALERLFFTPETPRNLGVARIILAVNALWIVLSRPGLPDLFSLPGVMWNTVLPERRIRFGMLFDAPVEQVLWIALHVLLLATLLGILTRWAALGSALLLYHFAPLERVFSSGSPYLLGFTLTLFGLLFVGVSRSGGALRGEDRSWEHRWPLALLQCVFCGMYAFAAYSKLITSGVSWLDARNIRLYILALGQVLGDRTTTPYGHFIAGSPFLCVSLASAGIAFELLFPVVLFSRTARLILVPVAVLFHVLNALIFRIEFPELALLLIFVDWRGLRSERTIPPWSRSSSS